MAQSLGTVGRERERERRRNPPVDLRLLEYVSAYDENLMCPICRCPFVEPVVLDDCDHHFCHDCIRQSWGLNPAYTPPAPRGNCPTCRNAARLSPSSATGKLLVNILSDLAVKCPNHDKGCLTVVRRGEVQDHVNLYCGHALVACGARDCGYDIERKDASRGCLHWPVTCLLCRTELSQGRIERHWTYDCPHRLASCGDCLVSLPYGQIDEHKRTTCAGRTAACPGQDLGCIYQGQRGDVDQHAGDCVFAKLKPILLAQKDRLDKQETAQKEISRKLDVLQSAFASMEEVVRNAASRDSSPSGNRGRETTTTPHTSGQVARGIAGLQGARVTTGSHRARWNESLLNDYGSEATSSWPEPPDDFGLPLRPSILMPASETATTNTSTTASTDDVPYTSPLHHLLSMHEALRDELQRISTTLSELDGRHSMQTLNENIRTREEISYLGAQVGGLQRQVHWLTSAQLQSQQSRGTTAGPSVGGAGHVDGVVGAVNNAATALRGAARMVGVGSTQDMPRESPRPRRGTSEEGRTKL